MKKRVISFVLAFVTLISVVCTSYEQVYAMDVITMGVEEILQLLFLEEGMNMPYGIDSSGNYNTNAIERNLQGFENFLKTVVGVHVDLAKNSANALYNMLVGAKNGVIKWSSGIYDYWKQYCNYLKSGTTTDIMGLGYYYDVGDLHTQLRDRFREIAYQGQFCKKGSIEDFFTYCIGNGQTIGTEFQVAKYLNGNYQGLYIRAEKTNYSTGTYRMCVMGLSDCDTWWFNKSDGKTYLATSNTGNNYGNAVHDIYSFEYSPSIGWFVDYRYEGWKTLCYEDMTKFQTVFLDIYSTPKTLDDSALSDVYKTPPLVDVRGRDQTIKDLAKLKELLKRLRDKTLTKDDIKDIVDGMTGALEIVEPLDVPIEDTKDETLPANPEPDKEEEKEKEPDVALPVVIPEKTLNSINDMWDDLKKRFPFCIPYDIKTLFESLQSEDNKPPHIKYEVEIPTALKDKQSIKIDIDFTPFKDVVAIFRSGVLIFLCIGLLLISIKFIHMVI